MNEILTDTRDEALREAVHANLHMFFAQLEHVRNARVVHDARFLRWHTNIAHSWFNGVVTYCAPDADALRWADETIAYFQAQDVRTFSWWFASRVERGEWDKELRKRNFKYNRGEPGMALCLDEPARKIAAPDAFQIVPVTEDAQLRDFVKTFLAGYEISAQWFEMMLELVRGFGLALPTRYYLGYLGDQLVATCMLFCAAGVAGIYNVATTPHARKQGIGAAITAAALADARAAGYRAAVLQSSTMGYHLYLELGFRHVTDMAHYDWLKT